MNTRKLTGYEKCINASRESFLKSLSSEIRRIETKFQNFITTYETFKLSTVHPTPIYIKNCAMMAYSDKPDNVNVLIKKIRIFLIIVEKWPESLIFVRKSYSSSNPSEIKIVLTLYKKRAPSYMINKQIVQTKVTINEDVKKEISEILRKNIMIFKTNKIYENASETGSDNEEPWKIVLQMNKQ